MGQIYLEKLQVQNFRNLSDTPVEFSSGINCVFGNNGNGKTNLLEAIYVLTTRKSFRKKTSFPQYLSVDGEKPEIILSSVFKNQKKETFSYSAKLNQERNEYFLGGRPCKKKPDFKIVFINPFDSFHFHNTASFRRNWFDLHLGQIDNEYKKAIKEFNQALKFRNTLLAKKPYKYKEQIFANEKEWVKKSFEITQRRKQFLAEINPFMATTFENIFDEKHQIELQLTTRINNMTQSSFIEYLAERWPKDDAANFTTYGIHKDDYELQFDGMNAYEFCSLGQQKMSYFSLLFAYIRLFGYKYMTFPIVLMDDVSGELDQLRWMRLVQFLTEGEYQVLITTANEKFREELEKLDHAKKIYIDAGEFINLS